jgi:hypothetical protein
MLLSDRVMELSLFCLIAADCSSYDVAACYTHKPTKWVAMEEERYCLANKQRYCLEKVSQDRFPNLKPHPSNLTPGGSRELD